MSLSTATEPSTPVPIRPACAFPDALASCLPARLAQLIGQIGVINSRLDGRELLDSILSAAARILESEASSLFLVDEENGDLILHVPTGPARGQVEGVRIPAGRGICGWVAAQGRPLLLNDPARDPRFFGDVAGGFVTRNLLCVPIRREDGVVIGVLQALNRVTGSYGEEDQALLAALSDQAALALERERLHRDTLERARLEEQLALAREIQAGLWPEPWISGVGGLRIIGGSRPAGSVGGDYYDHFTLADGRVAVALGDVCGKGPAAALLMCTVRSCLRSHLEHGLPLDEVMARVNRSLTRDTPVGRFTTLFCALIDPDTGVLDFVNGGHNPPLQVDLRWRTINELQIGGPVLGAFAELDFQVGRVTLEPGQVLVLFSDGVTEARDAAEEEFGDERFRQLLLEQAGDLDHLLERVFAAVDAHSGAEPQTDDLTLLALTLQEKHS
jgi:sigma-B regulation protein RsbU (phosphoserine phosphatase)